MKKKSKIERYTDQEALDYHNSGKSGKIEILSSKPMTSKRDLALAYSPGVAAPVKVIAENPDAAYDYTTKGNLVAVISNGSAILGLGNLGALASKPVMEGKAILFKRFADIDAIDLEIAGLYWHFVDIVWIVIFALLYLITANDGVPPGGIPWIGGH